jgi:hypothetical protein
MGNCMQQHQQQQATSQQQLMPQMWRVRQGRR